MAAFCFILMSLLIGVLLSCQQLSHDNVFEGNVEPIPYMAMGVCIASKIYNDEDRSTMYDCVNDKPIRKNWLNGYCDGDVDLSQNVMFNHQKHYDCSGGQCDYALVRAHPTCYIANNSEFTETAVPVNYCLKTKLDKDFGPIVAGEYLYIQPVCTNTTVTVYMYRFSDCSSPVGWIDWYEDGVCNDHNQYIQIIECTTSGYVIYHSEILSNMYVITWILIFSLGLFVSIWSTLKLFFNLYKFRRLFICNSLPAICCTITFSDKHNWIIEPSKLNKAYALLSMLSYIVMFLVYIILNILTFEVSDSTIYNSRYILLMSAIFSKPFYYLYMVSTVEYHANSDDIVQNMIPKKFIIFIKILIMSIIIPSALLLICDSIFNLITFSEITVIAIYIIELVRDLIIELSILYLYFSGLNNLCHYWYSKQWEEYDKYGENERIHELLIDITRVSIIVIVATIPSILLTTYQCTDQYFEWTNFFGFISSRFIDVIAQSMVAILRCLAIYFIYPFSHKHYEKVCGCCHKKVYRYFKLKHQKQIAKGGFDGLRYRSNKSQCGYCCYSCSKHMNQNNIQHIMLDDQNDDL